MRNLTPQTVGFSFARWGYLALNLNFAPLGIDLLKPTAIIRDMESTAATNETRNKTMTSQEQLRGELEALEAGDTLVVERHPVYADDSHTGRYTESTKKITKVEALDSGASYIVWGTKKSRRSFRLSLNSGQLTNTKTRYYITKVIKNTK